MDIFGFSQLDTRTRSFMIDEFNADSKSHRVYFGKRLNEHGKRIYLDALPEALAEGKPASLQLLLEPVPGLSWISATIASNGRRSTTPHNAAQILAEGEFNRYYMRAICMRSTQDGDGRVTVCRAKGVENARTDSLVKVRENDELDAESVLDDIRRHPGEDTEIGMPRGPNSGLSLEFTPNAE